MYAAPLLVSMAFSTLSRLRDMVRKSNIHWISGSDESTQDRRTAGLAGFAITLLLVVLALVIVRKLQVRCLIENCILAGGSECQHVAENLRVSRALEALGVHASSWITPNRNGR